MSMSRSEVIESLDSALDGIAGAEEWGESPVVVVGEGHHVASVSAFTDPDGEPVTLIELGQP
jgi:hypothetical protein